MTTSIPIGVTRRWFDRVPGLGWTEGKFVVGVAGLLITTAALKLHAGFLDPAAIPGREGLYEIPLRTWSIATALVELLAVGLMMGAPSRREALHVIRFVFGCFIAYRIALHLHGGGPCGCLGPLLASNPWQGKEGLLLGSVSGTVFALNECFILRRRLGRTRAASSNSAISGSAGGDVEVPNPEV